MLTYMAFEVATLPPPVGRHAAGLSLPAERLKVPEKRQAGKARRKKQIQAVGRPWAATLYPAVLSRGLHNEIPGSDL